ncbi:MAG: glycosyltransferase [Chitinophagales bacterium]|nr:glycosyltransferase [Chitinophagales bacterium]
MKESLPIYIVIPIYNSSKYIIEVLDVLYLALKEIRYPNISVILSDDSSNDTTVFIIKKYIEERNITNFHLLERKKNVGQSLNTIYAISSLPTPSYCITMDSDMQPSPEVLKDFIPYCLQSKQNLIIGNFNVHKLGLRYFISKLYGLIISFKAKKNLLFNYGSSFRWFYFDGKLKDEFFIHQGRIDILLLKNYKEFLFYKIDYSQLKNYSQLSMKQLLKNIIRNS